MKKMKVDIVGGGLAGLSSAISIKKFDKNIKTIVHEKHKKIGYNPDGRRCGEGHTVESVWRHWRPSESSIFNKIDTVYTYVGNKKYTANVEKGIGFVLNRQEFISQLGKQAEELEVMIKTEDKVKSIDDLDGDYIIDASGCPSIIKKRLGINKGIKGLSYQQTLENSNCFSPNDLKVFFTDSLGYYWIFPRNPEKKEINVGVGVLYNSKKPKLKNILREFKKKQGIEGEVNYSTGGFVPAGLQKPLSYKNILFVGDAGVGTHPILGKGIYRALYSGELAAKCIAKGYPEKYKKIVSHDLIKWDIIGKSYIRIGGVMNEISGKALLCFYRKYLDLWYSIFQK